MKVNNYKRNARKMKNCKNLILILISILPVWAGMASDETIADPYGIQSPLSVGPEMKIINEQMELMDEAGIKWIRVVMFRSMVEKADGSLYYRIFDEITAAAKKNNKQIHCILMGFPDAKRKPPMEHMNSWLNIVRNFISRYQDVIKSYEIWNEQNIGHFWGEEPNPVEYTELLKQAYLEIKKINPTLSVAYGGTSGVPFDYIEATLKAGAGKWFDVMSIHPYEWGVGPEVIIPKIEKLHGLLKKYDLGDKPIWITETGWSTAQQVKHTKKIMVPVLKRLNINPSETTLGIVRDTYQYGDERSTDLFPKFKRTKFFTLAEVNKININQVPVLIALLLVIVCVVNLNVSPTDIERSMTPRRETALE